LKETAIQKNRFGEDYALMLALWWISPKANFAGLMMTQRQKCDVMGF
jgi:hypothetical protein